MNSRSSMGSTSNTSLKDKSLRNNTLRKSVASLIITILLISIISYAPTATAVSVNFDGITINESYPQSVLH